MTHWNDREVIQFLKHDIPTQLMDDAGNIKYDGLIVCISCHGIKNKIITSNDKQVDKTLLLFSKWCRIRFR